MEWKKIEDEPKEFNDWKYENENDSIEGRYMGYKEVGENKSRLHIIENDNGEITFFGKTVLDRKLSQVSKGEMVKIVYLGRKPSGAGKQPFYDFDVYKGLDIPAEEI